MHEPVRIPWDQAPSRLASLALAAGPRPVVGICGPVGAGKSALAARLSACVLSTDHYLPDYDSVPYEERDLPERADLTRLLADVASLREGRPTRVPVWSFKTHRREGEREVSGGPIIVVEGIHALHETVAAALDLAVFVEAGEGVRWARWEYLETSGARGWGPRVARRFFEEVAEPTFARYRAAYLARAHAVVLNDHGVPAGP